MPLALGTRLGSYQITAKIGEGGMGEVYRARDTKLDRDVALKVLPLAFTEDPDRLARFEREAKVLASLNHPGIAAIHGLEESGGVKALVLELVEGPTLADRIEKGPIPLDEALPIAKQIAEALEAAHEAGVIHRDLKPANIKVRDDGTVKVLDFGLAKALDPTPEGDPSQSPTLTAAATQMGVIMGTAAYMSPEQARGKHTDRRSDIWAFGAVLFEMLTGKRAFEGEDVSVTLANVINQQPNWEPLPDGIGAALRTFLQRCLVKDPTRRVQAIGDVRLAMEGAFDAIGPVGPESIALQPTRKRQALIWAVGLGLAAAAGMAVSTAMRRPPSTPTMRFDITSSVDLRQSNSGIDVAISPDGMTMVYVSGPRATQRAVTVRLLDDPDARSLDATVPFVPSTPFVSPDSEWIGFYGVRNRALQRVSMLGGAVGLICELPVDGGGLVLGASWGAGDNVVFGTSERSGLWRVAASGGEPVEITAADEGENHVWPEMLPEGRAVVFTIWRASVDDASVALFDFETGMHKVLIENGHAPHYLRSGHLVYSVGDTLLAVGFDPGRSTVTTDPVRVTRGVNTKFNGAANVAVSETGTLVYLTGGAGVDARRPVWVDRAGNEEDLGIQPQPFEALDLSPDGRQLAISTNDGIDADVWLYDVERGTGEPLTTHEAEDGVPLWAPDGQRVLFSSSRTGERDIYAVSTATGELEQLTSGPGFRFPRSWSDDGRTLVLDVISGPRGSAAIDIGSFNLETKESTYLLATRFSEQLPTVSPNGRWLAYGSDESGEPQVYVRPFPNVESGRRHRISDAGGSDPLWAPEGTELYYRHEGAVYAVSVEADAAFVVGQSEKLFDGPYFTSRLNAKTWDLGPDSRFLMLRLENGELVDDLAVQLVLNWHEALERLVPTP